MAKPELCRRCVEAVIAIGDLKVNNGGSLVDRNFLSTSLDCDLLKNWYYSKHTKHSKDMSHEGLVGGVH